MHTHMKVAFHPFWKSRTNQALFNPVAFNNQTQVSVNYVHKISLKYVTSLQV